MKRFISIILVSLLCSSFSFLYAEEVPMDVAKDYADRFMQQFAAKSMESSVIQPFQQDAATYTYVVNYQPEGWVLLSADDRVEPILAYSNEGHFDIEEVQTLPFYFWFEGYKVQIEQIIVSKTGSRNPNWDHIPAALKSKAVDPLIKMRWNQNAGWNQFCPADPSGPGGRTYAGCVAVATALNMSVYKHPNKGYGSKTYTSSYGVLTANYGETNYRWDLVHPTTANEHSALILFHLGVAVNMSYGSDGSGAYSRNVPAAIKSYFDYSNDATLLSKSNYSDNEWIKLMMDELQAGRPVYYAGDGNNNEAGHAFNLDGTDGINKFHFNWGWGGSYNGYFFLNALSPGTSSFTHNQQAIVHFKPRNHWPVDIFLSNNSIEEGLPGGSVVGQFTVKDETPNDSHVFEVSGPESLFGFIITVPFTADRNKLVTTAPINRSDAERYEVFVKAIDNQGYHVSKSFFIDVRDGSAGSVSVSDIPASNSFKLAPSKEALAISFLNDYSGNFQLSLFDMSGRRVLSESLTKSAHEFNHVVNLQRFLPSGVYLLNLDFPEADRISRKFMLP